MVLNPGRVPTFDYTIRFGKAGLHIPQNKGQDGFVWGKINP
jgi:hypothetical protein